MADSQDVLLAVLALDAYDQGYSPGMTLANNTSVDGAQIIATSSEAIGKTADNASFYAIEYNVAGQLVISYRGTRFDGNYLGVTGPDLGDVMNGWTLSAGYAAASQAQLALQFYTDVTGAFHAGRPQSRRDRRRVNGR